MRPCGHQGSSRPPTVLTFARIRRQSTDATRSPGIGALWLLLGLVAAALTLRAPISGLSALLDPVSSGLALSGWAVSLVTTLPTVCLGVFAFLGPVLRHRFGEERVIAVCTVLLLSGGLLRMITSPSALFGGTLLVVAALGLINVLVPGLIKRSFADRYVGVTALYTITMTLGAAGAAAAAAPLAHLTGSSWAAPLALVTVPLALVAGVFWLPLVRIHSEGDLAPIPPGLWRDRLAWQVTVLFGSMALTSYVVLGWLPEIVRDRGMSLAASGLVLSVSALVQAVGVIGVPWVTRRTRDQRLLAVLVVLLNTAGLVGVVLAPAPTGIWVCAVVLGLGQGAGFGMCLTLIGLRSRDAGSASGLSGMAQGVGYLIAAIGPLGAGLLHSLSGGWHVPLVLLLVACLVQLLSGLAAGRNRFVLDTASVTAEGNR